MASERVKIIDNLTNADDGQQIEILVNKTMATMVWDYVVKRVNTNATNEHSEARHESSFISLNRKFQPKRPMNPFMLWTQAIRRKLSEQYSNIRNAQLSKTLGRMWSVMDYELRRPYLEEAERIRITHRANYPNYRYQPRRRRRGTNSSELSCVQVDLGKEDNLEGRIYRKRCKTTHQVSTVNTTSSIHSKDIRGSHAPKKRLHNYSIGREIDQYNKVFRNFDNVSHHDGLGSTVEEDVQSKILCEFRCFDNAQRDSQGTACHNPGGIEWTSLDHANSCYENRHSTMIESCGCISEGSVEMSHYVQPHSDDVSSHYNESSSEVTQKYNDNQNNVVVSIQSAYALECCNGGYGQTMYGYQQPAVNEGFDPGTNE